MKLPEILKAIASLPEKDRSEIYTELKKQFQHPLEKNWGLEAHAIMEAIARSSDLTQRGVRGVIAESVFVLQVLPEALAGSDWKPIADTSIADTPFDAVVENVKTGKNIRIQVKNQRREAGEPKELKDCWVVEVQKTRSGEKNGEKTRPYRFVDFDLIAVCMYPSSGEWTRFCYAPVKSLKSRKENSDLIEIMQLIPKSLGGQGWTKDLSAALAAQSS